MFIYVNSVQERLRYFREQVRALSLREFRAAINAHLPADEALSLGTVSNYERPPSSADDRRPGPRVEFLAALKAAFPEIRLDWVMFGEGQPTDVAQLLASPAGFEAAGDLGGFSARVLERYPDLELLPPEGAALFMAALTRLAMGEPEKRIDEGLLLELAGDLRWLILLPASMWGFRHAPPYEVFSDYTVAMLHALMLLLPPAGAGDPVAVYDASRGPVLRADIAVGFE